jgi:hypothetical protein
MSLDVFTFRLDGLFPTNKDMVITKDQIIMTTTPFTHSLLGWAPRRLIFTEPGNLHRSTPRTIR